MKERSTLQEDLNGKTLEQFIEEYGFDVVILSNRKSRKTYIYENGVNMSWRTEAALFEHVVPHAPSLQLNHRTDEKKAASNNVEAAQKTVIKEYFPGIKEQEEQVEPVLRRAFVEAIENIATDLNSATKKPLESSPSTEIKKQTLEQVIRKAQKGWL